MLRFPLAFAGAPDGVLRVPWLEGFVGTLGWLLRSSSGAEGPPGNDSALAEPKDLASAAGEPDNLVADLAERFWDRLRYFAARRLRDRALAEDVAQEVLKRALEALRAGRVENEAALPAFLFQTARHICLQRWRSAGRESKAFARMGGDSQGEPMAEEDPLVALITEERKTAVREALDRLGDTDRRLLEMSYSDGTETSEIAALLHLTTGAVRVRRHRALARLSELLGVTRPPDRRL